MSTTTHTNAPSLNAAPVKRGRPRETTPGYRVNVLKPGLRKRTERNRKADWTCIYISGLTSKKLDALATGSRPLICEAVRRSAVGAVAQPGETFSAVVIRRATKLLELHAAKQKAQAAENNSAWEAQ